MADNFLFHEVSDKEREEIKKQAKCIMDSFSEKLSKVDKEMKEPTIERKNCEREESSECDCYEIDPLGGTSTLKGTSREIMFGNAPGKNADFIIAEKGGWRE